jgi:hypothetical protein
MARDKKNPRFAMRKAGVVPDRKGRMRVLIGGPLRGLIYFQSSIFLSQAAPVSPPCSFR